MNSCQTIDPLVTPYVDGELASAERQRVDHHLARCASCHARVAAEQAVRDLVASHRPALGAEHASPALRARCQAVGVARNAALEAGQAERGGRLPRWSGRLAPLALAAALVMIVGGGFVYKATEKSTLVMAAELTADHVKCFALNSVLGTHDEATAVEQAMLSGFGWRMRAAERFDDVGLRLVGSRRCLYGEGRMAHLMYRHNGRPVSVFMLRRRVPTEEIIDVMGHEAAVWSAGGRTFVLIAHEPRAEVVRMASTVQAAFP